MNLKDKTVMITGGTGSLGHMLTKTILKKYPDIGKIIIEYKHYGSSVASHQIEKLKRDMCAQNINYSVMMSYKSPICGKKEFDIDMFDGNKLIVYIHTAGYDGHCLILAIRLLSHLVKFFS